jgi:RNA recognition motif-containing protein
VDITKDSGGAVRGYAFIEFEDFDPVDKCILQKRHEIAGHACEVRKTLSQEDLLVATQKLTQQAQARSDGSPALKRGRMSGNSGYGPGPTMSWQSASPRHVVRLGLSLDFRHELATGRRRIPSGSMGSLE